MSVQIFSFIMEIVIGELSQSFKVHVLSIVLSYYLFCLLGIKCWFVLND